MAKEFRSSSEIPKEFNPQLDTTSLSSAYIEYLADPNDKKLLRVLFDEHNAVCDNKQTSIRCSGCREHVIKCTKSRTLL